MRFKIVSVGWSCAQFIPWTLDSVAMQSLDNWDIAVVYDRSDDNGAKVIREWCEKDPEHRLFRINTDQKYAPRNQYEAVHEMLRPEDDDVLIFLDLDGDKLAHQDVLKVLDKAYQDGALVTYGQYRPVPPTEVHKVGQACEWPPEVVRDGTYRLHTLMNGPCFNHLRTVAWSIFRQIPESCFRWESGEWYKGATDYAVMIPALELANGRHKFISEVILDYNHANPLADNTNQYREGRPGHDATLDILRRPRMYPIVKAIPVARTPLYGRDVPGSTDLYMSADQRREVLRRYGKQYGLNVFIESGTNDGSTPWFLKDDFRDLYTIELAKDLWKAAAVRFRGYPRVHCLLGDSTEILVQILAEIKEPALLWLDGHYSGGITARGELDTPVRQELEALFADARPHVILVDDARIFEGGPEHFDEPHYHDYPSLEWVELMANAHGFDFVLEDDIMRLTPKVAYWGSREEAH